MGNDMKPLIRTHRTQIFFSIILSIGLVFLIIVLLIFSPTNVFSLIFIPAYYSIMSIFSIFLLIRVGYKRVWNEFFHYFGLLLFLNGSIFNYYLPINYDLLFLAGVKLPGLILWGIGASNYPRNVQRRQRKLKSAAPLLIKSCQDISSFENGYTPRPYSLSTRLEFEGSQFFSSFCKSYVKFLAHNFLIVGKSIQQESLFLFVTKNFKKRFFRRIKDFLQFRGDIERQSWVRILQTGDIQVKFSQKDYDEFTEPASYHEICSSLGHTFEKSIQLFLRGSNYGSLYSLLPEVSNKHLERLIIKVEMLQDRLVRIIHLYEATRKLTYLKKKEQIERLIEKYKLELKGFEI
ncbi:MAG: hypothetical protein ACFFD2_04385 [Promethearchaeota archaeon]